MVMVIYLRVKDCFERGLLRRTDPSKELAKKSLKQAMSFLDECKSLLEMEKRRMAVIALYSAFFHAARSLLFKDGVKEKSHFCIARYIEEEYTDRNLLDVKFLNAFETVRDMRHETQYSLDVIEITEDLFVLSDVCYGFIGSIERILGGLE